jgi:pectate lyase-like protein
MANTSINVAVSSQSLGLGFNVKDFGATGDGVSDDTAAIQAAINAAYAAGGGEVLVPISLTPYVMTSTLSMLAGVTLRGHGPVASRLTWATLGDGIACVGTVNGHTVVNTAVRYLSLACTNAANVGGGGYTDLGGSIVELTNVHITGFGYGIIFDQTELGSVDLCDVELQNTGGIWLCNGADHTPGAATQFTNLIRITRTSINQGSAVFGIIDDGGQAHVYRSNNLNGCICPLRLAGCLTVVVDGANYFEGAGANASIDFEGTTRKTGTGVGACQGGAVVGNFINQTNSQPGILVSTSGASGMVIKGNYVKTDGVGISGLSHSAGQNEIGTNFYSGAGTLYDGAPFELFCALVNGANADVVLPTMTALAEICPLVEVTGPTGTFTISGFGAGFAGQRFTLYNRQGFTMTLQRENGGSLSANRISNATNADIIIPSAGAAVLFYDHTVTRWVVESVSFGAYNTLIAGWNAPTTGGGGLLRGTFDTGATLLQTAETLAAVITDLRALKIFNT